MVEYAPSKATRTIVVYELALTLSLSKAKVVPGESVRFSGKLTKDGVGWGGRTVTVLIAPDFSVDVITGTDGTYSKDWVIPWTTETRGPTPGKTFKVTAWHLNPNVNSPTLDLTVVAPTRISLTALSEVAAGAEFAMFGKLEAQMSQGVFTPLGNEYVYLSYGVTSLGKEMTDAATGEYKKMVSILTRGTYTLAAEFKGTAITAVSFAMSEITVEGVAPLPEIPVWAWALAVVLSIIGGAVAIGGMRDGAD